MTVQKETFSRFGKNFQESLCQLMLEDRPFCDQISEVLNTKFLELRYLQVFVNILSEHRETYKTHPSYDTMATYIKADLGKYDDAIQTQVRNFYARVMSSEVGDPDFIKDKAIEFCRKQVLKEAMLQSVKLIKSSSFDEIQKVIQLALTLGTDNNFGHDYFVDFEKRFELKSRNPVSMGWPRMDDLCKGGLGSSELGVVIAPTGAGKSMVLAHMGATALEQGKTVIHYTLELADTVVGGRYDSCITGIPLNDLYHSKDMIYEKIQNIAGHLIIKEYPTKSATSSTLRNHIEKLRKRGINPDMIIVDYADLLRPVKSNSEKRHELETIYEDLRGIAQEYKCPVWTASQTNRSGLNAEVITMEAISEAFNKCFVADFIFSLSRTATDKQANKGRFFIAKNRNGPDGLVFPVFMDTSNVSIKVLERQQDDDEETVKQSPKETLSYLKKQYAQTKK
tara:strand:+ start:3875 stop:5230 length:1356 start_codon:yes stop_codon:yes gene_type:complete